MIHSGTPCTHYNNLFTCNMVYEGVLCGITCWNLGSVIISRADRLGTIDVRWLMIYELASDPGISITHSNILDLLRGSISATAVDVTRRANNC